MTNGALSGSPNESLLADLLQGFDGMMWESTPKAGSLIFIGKKLQSSLGYPPERFLDKPMFWLDIVHADDRKKVFQVIEQARSSGEVSVFDHRIRTASGAWIWLRNILRVVPTADGKVAKTYGIAFDISRLRRVESEVEDARRRAAFLAEASKILAGSLDYETTLKNVARVAVPSIADWCCARLLTAEGEFRELAVVHADPAKEALVRQILQHYPPSPQDLHGPGRVLSSGQSEVREAGEPISVQHLIAPEYLDLIRQIGIRSYLCVPMVARGHVLGTISLAISESDRRYTDADMALAEDLAARAAMAIENARFYREAREEVRRREAFLAVLGHELRNPLGAISNAVRVLEAVEHDDPRARTQRDILARQTNQLGRLVDDLLDVSRIISGKIRLVRRCLNLCSETERCLQTFRANDAVGERQIEISLPQPDLFVDADDVRLEQIVLNLLNNALKFTSPRGHIRVEVAHEGAHAVIRVRDDGVGISAEQLPHIFDAFRQGTERLGEGLGIGLALVRTLADLHDGSVGAASPGVGRGSEFTVRLPLAKDGVESSPGRSAGQTDAGRRILIVEDDRDSLDSLQTLLELMGHQVMGLRDGSLALEAAQSWQPAVALVDIGLPRLDGYEVCRRLRAMGLEPRPMLIALTGYGQPEDRRRALEAGFDDHLTKPIDLERLRQLLATGSAVASVASSPAHSG